MENKVIKTILFVINVLPVAVIVYAFYVIPMWIIGDFKFAGFASFLVAEFHLSGNMARIHKKLWNRWDGFGGPGVIILRTKPIIENNNNEYLKSIRKHELEHARQFFVLGIFQPLFYFLFSVIIFVSCKFLNAYFDNPFEISARRAESNIEVGKDRWPWW